MNQVSVGLRHDTGNRGATFIWKEIQHSLLGYMLHLPSHRTSSLNTARMIWKPLCMTHCCQLISIPVFYNVWHIWNKSTNAKGHKQYISIHPRGNSPWWVFTALHICPLPTSKGKTWGISSSTACKAFSADAWEDVAPAATQKCHLFQGVDHLNMVDWRLLSSNLFNIVSIYFLSWWWRVLIKLT